jgi:hypothetical protein
MPPFFSNYKKLVFYVYIHTIQGRFIFYSLIKMKNKIQILVFALVAVFGFV